MAQFNVSFFLDNEAFAGTPSEREAAICEVLREVAYRLEENGTKPDEKNVIRDTNGNKIGHWVETS